MVCRIWLHGGIRCTPAYFSANRGISALDDRQPYHLDFEGLLSKQVYLTDTTFFVIASPFDNGFIAFIQQKFDQDRVLVTELFAMI